MYQYEEIILKLLEQSGIQVKIANDEVRCCCPFHEENNPSFSINLETGKYICFSGSCGVKGDIYSFVSKITKRSYDDVKKSIDINLENLKYNNIITNVLNSFKIKDLKKQDIISHNSYKFIDLKDLRDEQIILNLINVKKQISDLVGLKICLTNPYKRRLVVPIAQNIYEFRDLTKKSTKKCLYESGIKTSEILFKIIVDKSNSIFITEGTKDAMTIAGYGFNSCCTFGVNISTAQITEILKTGKDKVFIMRDNDEAGFKSNMNTFRSLKKYCDCKIIKYPKGFIYKDPNEIKTKIEFLNLLRYNVNSI